MLVEIVVTNELKITHIFNGVALSTCDRDIPKIRSAKLSRLGVRLVSQGWTLLTFSKLLTFLNLLNFFDLGSQSRRGSAPSRRR